VSAPLLEVRDLSVHFELGGGLFARPRLLRAVERVSFTVAAGESLGLVGESGCGKSTVGRAVLQLVPPTSGRVLWLGQDLARLPAEELRARRRELQIVFQDPLASLDPRMPVGEIIAEPLVTHEPRLGRAEVRARVEAAMAEVGLLPQMRNRYPHEFSGGQCQRIGIARALILRPRLVVCDEPVSALDVSIQAQIVNLLAELQRRHGLSLLFISHNLAVVRQVCQRILVLYLGRIVELAPREALFAAPRHPYTRALIAAVPEPDPALERGKRRVLLQGELPSPLAPPSGCVFRTRCPIASELCAREVPYLATLAPDHDVACHHAE
jgi:oligopeptide transport system ATP-binding protein